MNIDSKDGTMGNADYSTSADITKNTNNVQISMNYSNKSTPRCKIMKDCTVNHYYYPHTKTSYTQDPDGNVSCSCTHDPGNMVLNTNNAAHSHCENTDELPTVQDFLYNTIEDTNRTAVKSMNTSFTSNCKSSACSTYDDKITDFINKQNESTDKQYRVAIDKIVDKIADYYVALLDNKYYGEKLKQIFVLNDGSSAYLSDSSQLYKNNFLKIANLSIGSVFLLGCIFALSRNG